VITCWWGPQIAMWITKNSRRVLSGVRFMGVHSTLVQTLRGRSLCTHHDRKLDFAGFQSIVVQTFSILGSCRLRTKLIKSLLEGGNVLHQCLGLCVTPRSLVVLKIVEEAQDTQNYREEGLGCLKNGNVLETYRG